jgi:hypothetical protein
VSSARPAGNLTGFNQCAQSSQAGKWLSLLKDLVMVFIVVRAGQINTRGGIIKRQRNPLAFWAILAGYLLLALIGFAGGLKIMLGRL